MLAVYRTACMLVHTWMLDAALQQIPCHAWQQGRSHGAMQSLKQCGKSLQQHFVVNGCVVNMAMLELESGQVAVIVNHSQHATVHLQASIFGLSPAGSLALDGLGFTKPQGQLVASNWFCDCWWPFHPPIGEYGA
ncbi:TPA: hypothetical protein ACH3X2_000685 [Trebouxia sp. C0005]